MLCGLLRELVRAGGDGDSDGAVVGGRGGVDFRKLYKQVLVEGEQALVDFPALLRDSAGARDARVLNAR